MQVGFRARRFAEVDRMLRKILEERSTASVLDAGGAPAYWENLAEDLRPKVRVTCLNFSSEFEWRPNAQGDLSIEMVAGDACDMPQYADGSFDLAHSNSVIEHVGSYQNMLRFAREVSRVGRAYYVQTPSYWFPMDPHCGAFFWHWRSDNARVRLMTRRDIGYAKRRDFEQALKSIDHTRMITAFIMRNLFPDAEIKKEKVAFLTKSLIAVRDLDGGQSKSGT